MLGVTDRRTQARSISLEFIVKNKKLRGADGFFVQGSKMGMGGDIENCFAQQNELEARLDDKTKNIKE